MTDLTTDLVEWLRFIDKDQGGHTRFGEAAEEVERLRGRNALLEQEANDRISFELQAKAVLDDMHEPTEAMIKAAWGCQDPITAWKSMLGAYERDRLSAPSRT